MTGLFWEPGTGSEPGSHILLSIPVGKTLGAQHVTCRVAERGGKPLYPEVSAFSQAELPLQTVESLPGM